ncbi:MAG: hypothetical protein GTO55_02135 [Armatimonadetes bacterium]|nr:hypothetical protein [Armatimonadota bacterium]NIM23078.1 hypothetical protein [Armatimonadota bacterium]NIM66946.1 hypothetical protein [Armatimonadota bacterium]NIM75480.1 hypothetical protein [Armatimonadota bacterium]NIN05137.1 hypothetical protein [Armatimonadota bacterium]
MLRPSPPPTLIYDHGADKEALLPGRLESRWREVAPLNVIVRLKDGTTRLGRICYFDTSRLTLAEHGQLHDLMYRDIAHIVMATVSL